jgi:hypothetical protein
VISTAQGTDPRWSKTGHDLFYRSPEGMMAVGYSVKGDTFVADKPRVWRANFSDSDYDLAPDGKRFVVVTSARAAEQPKPEHEVVFLQNFLDELRRRVPAK